jgi:hypothetical protein
VSQQDEAGVYQQAGRDVQCGSEKERIQNRETTLVRPRERYWTGTGGKDLVGAEVSGKDRPVTGRGDCGLYPMLPASSKSMYEQAWKPLIHTLRGCRKHRI